MPKTSSIHPCIIIDALIEHRLVTDRQTDGHRVTASAHASRVVQLKMVTEGADVRVICPDTSILSTCVDKMTWVSSVDAAAAASHSALDVYQYCGSNRHCHCCYNP